ncbi:N-acetylmuramoyl-L-alanine amidase family protein [Pelagihabitans pacificus]
MGALISSFANNNSDGDKDGVFVVVLDAGHGGHDPGNLGNGYFEKNIALNIVLNIGKILEKEPDIKVIYTRKDDTFVDLYVRGEIANKANADLFVSVHCDSHSSNAQGAGTFVLGLHANEQNFEIAKKENSVIYLEDNYETRYADYDINSPESVIGLTIMQEEFLDQSIRLAKGIQDNFSHKLKRNDRKVKQAGFIVLHQTFMPSVLIETGFLTNNEEGAYLNSKKGQEEMGRAIARAILDYKNGVQPGGGGDDKTVAPVVEADDKTEAVVQETPKKPEDIPEELTISKEKGTLEAKTVETIQSVGEEETPEPPKVVAEIGKKQEEETPKPKSSVEGITKTPKKEIASETGKSREPEIATKTPSEPPKKSTSITYKVQIMASTKDLDLRSDNFRGLNKLSREPYKNMYRYMYGGTTSFEEAELLKANADVKGYTTSFIVAYKDGERIPVPEARKYVSD